jgi:tetratricopeptide (TPR) repeat protein
VEGDGEGLGTITCCEACCIEDLELSEETRAQADARWERRDAWAKHPRREDNSGVMVIASDWIAEAERYFDWSKREDSYAERPVDPDDPYGRWRGQGPYPRLTAIRPDGTSGDLQELFVREDYVNLLVAQFSKLLKARAGEVAVRGAAISLYWGLATLYPRDSDSYSAFDEITGREKEIEYSVTDTSDYWAAQRRIFNGYLAHVVRMLDLAECKDWERTKWEIVNAYSAQDWYLARRLFDIASTMAFLPETELIAIRSHFEYLAVFGPDIDRRAGIGPEGKRISEFSSLRDDICASYPFRLEALNSPPALLKAGDGEFELPKERSRYLVPFIWGLVGDPPTTSAEQDKHLRWVTEALPRAVETLGSSTPYYRSILAQCYEATGRPAEAAEQLSLIGKEAVVAGVEGFDSGDFTLRSAMLYRVAGNLEQAAKVLASATELNPTDGRMWVELAEIQFHLLHFDDAQESARKAQELRPNAKVEPILQVILKLSKFQIDPEYAKARAAELPRFDRLSNEAQREWLHATELDLLASEFEALQDACRTSSAGCHSKAAEVQLKTIFMDFRAQSRATAESILEAKLSGTLVDNHFYDFLLNKWQLSLGDMLTTIRHSPSSQSATMRSFVQYLDGHHAALRRPDVIGILEELRIIGNDHRHNTLSLERAGKAKELARKALEAMLL